MHLRQFWHPNTRLLRSVLNPNTCASFGQFWFQILAFFGQFLLQIHTFFGQFWVQTRPPPSVLTSTYPPSSVSSDSKYSPSSVSSGSKYAPPPVSSDIHILFASFGQFQHQKPQAASSILGIIWSGLLCSASQAQHHQNHSLAIFQLQSPLVIPAQFGRISEQRLQSTCMTGLEWAWRARSHSQKD